MSANRACNYYARPSGVMGGPCLNCGRSQPEHVHRNKEPEQPMTGHDAERTVYVFLTKRPQDKQAWPNVYADPALAEKAFCRCSKIEMVSLREIEPVNVVKA